MELFCFKDMQLFNVTLHQNSKLDSLRLGLTFQIENPLSCRRVWKVDLWNIYKNKISQDLRSTVTDNKHTIIGQKRYCCLGKIFILAMVNWIWCCTNFNLLNLMLHFVLPSSFSLFTIFQLSSTVFAFYGLSTVSSSLTFSVLFLLFCYFDILFLFMVLCLFIANSVHYADKLIKY